MYYKKIYSFMLLAAGVLLAASCNSNATGGHQFQVKKITDYLYEVTLDYDFDYAVSKPLSENFRPNLPACSSISLGNFRGRNLDWYYEDGSDFVVHTTKRGNRHASLGVTSATFLSNDVAGDIAANGQYQQELEALPFSTLDGINDAGICVNLNVVAFQEFGKWQMKTETTDDDMMEFMAPRIILDNCTYMTDIVPTLEKYDWFSVGNNFETHLMVSGPRSADDATLTSAILEYIPFTENGKTFRKLCVISQDEKDVALVGGDAARFWLCKGDYFIMTNFNLWKFEADKDRKGRLLSAAEHPSGFERYEILEAACKTAITVLGSTDSLTSQHIQDIMFTVNYSNMYNIYQDNFWYSEYIPYISKEEIINATPQQRSPHGDLNNLIQGKDNQFVNGFKEVMKQWGSRDRKVKSNLWETIHTSIYDYEKRTLTIGVREGSVYYNFEM